jgi:hypothetical protein
MDARFAQMNGQFARLDRKLDRFIDRNVPPEPPG